MVTVSDAIIFLFVFAIIYLLVGIIGNRQMLNQVLLGLDNPKKKDILKYINIGLLLSFGFLIVNIIHVFLILMTWWDAPPPLWAEISPYIIFELIFVCAFLTYEALLTVYYQLYMREYHLTP